VVIMKKEYKIIVIVILAVLLLTTILYSFFYSYQNTGLFTLPSKYTQINKPISNNNFIKISDIFKPKTISLPFVYGNVKDINNMPLSNADIYLYYDYKDESNKIYRIQILNTKTTNSGYFYFNIIEFKNKLLNFNGSLPKQPYSIFLMVSKDGFMDKYIYDYNEQEKLVYENNTWYVNVDLDKLVAKKQIVDGNIFVSFYPGQESCANLALNYMKEYYFKVKNILGIIPYEQKTEFIFQTYSEHGPWPWLGGFWGISGVCYPWTDNISNNQIEDMWLEIVPHELTHHFLSFKLNDQLNTTYLLPTWANEGLAYYMQKTTNNINIDCNKDYLISLNEFISANTPQYHSAGCVFSLLENNKPGFIKKMIALDKQITFNNSMCTYNIIENYSSSNISGYFIKNILSQAYGSDLTDFFVNNFGFNKTDINKGYNNVINYLNECNIGD